MSSLQVTWIEKIIILIQIQHALCMLVMKLYLVKRNIVMKRKGKLSNIFSQKEWKVQLLTLNVSGVLSSFTAEQRKPIKQTNYVLFLDALASLDFKLSVTE